MEVTPPTNAVLIRTVGTLSAQNEECIRVLDIQEAANHLNRRQRQRQQSKIES